MIIVAGLYALNRFHLIQVSCFDGFLHCYLNDTLAPLVLIPLFINIHIAAGLRRNTLPPCLIEVAVYFFVLSVFFEWIAPTYNARSVADIYDVLAYFAGSVIYFGIMGEKLYRLDWLPLEVRSYYR